MAEVNSIILTGYGINCDDETQHVLTRKGEAVATKVHINDLLDDPQKLESAHILAVPGGFSYGDDIASGKVFANKLHGLSGYLTQFIDDGKLIIGICNGFQVLVRAGLLPGFDKEYTNQRVTLTDNNSGKYECRWISLVNDQVDLVNDEEYAKNTHCIWAKGIQSIKMPVAHKEGKFFAEDGVLQRLQDENLIVFRYAIGGVDIPAGGAFPHNPNGSLDDIAGITDPTGQILGMMPHPERFMHRTQHPMYTRQREARKRNRCQPLPVEGSGRKIFNNGINYAKEHLVR